MILLANQALYSRRLEAVHSRIEKACLAAGRNPSNIKLLAVSKGHDAAAISALSRLGLRSFGENYAVEGQEKIKQISDPVLSWHFIGPLQSNKSRLVAKHFDWIQSLDRASIAERLSRQRPGEMEPLKVLIQVNIDDEPQKSGIPAAALDDLAQLVSGLEGLQLRGLMVIPQVRASESGLMQSFGKMRGLFDGLKRRYATVDTLSMGMSADLEYAIRAGSTMIRVGTALFGARPKQGVS